MKRSSKEMLIKSIFCKVNSDQKGLFSERQQEWQAISSTEGFLGQIGGWSVKDPLTACIFAFWENQAAYQYFMDEVHDRIFFSSGQKETYISIQIDRYQAIPGSQLDIDSILLQAGFIRASFLDGIEKGMKEAAGMLGGVLAVSQKNPQQFLAFTGWKNEGAYQKYMAEHLSDLTSNIQLIVEESWRVCPPMR